MPPKKGPTKPNKDKAKKKVIEDKTFGLKNKNKSTKVKNYVQQVEATVNAGGNRKDKVAAEDRKKEVETKKLREQQKKDELAELFKVVQIQQKVPFGIDPKTVLCVNFKNGSCTRGDKCKFSHDLEVGRKKEKINLYADNRPDGEKSADTMDTWDQAKLEEVVTSKNGNPKTTTDIVCKYFLDAIDQCKYGWFWECPNGSTCKYRHALPPGFVLKKKGVGKKEDEDEISLETFLETERLKLGPNLTPVTLETFNVWKKSRKDRKDAEADAQRSKKEAAFRAGKSLQVSGRELFDFNPDLANDAYDDDEDVFDFDTFERRDGDQDGEDEGKMSLPSSVQVAE
ncbi:hypothetical protein BJ684DRAFT_9442 [Piptocephalis cylindrospora]|uniref:C3H1-type domain-containing protein n=1 Tax=Piptocephalis cylindrospora TaxID=1907219 RepID=A0A4V1IYA5_9FUNG|nr:hypothetical protein BJ684DRAFT_9442 [Piptocephalis cylindrospora]|eukprot:RKP13879.1 hypothetical protein BJ684DRAFT_9442 [Piptocephalis cylindrospora]